MTEITLFQEGYIEDHFKQCFLAIHRGIEQMPDKEILENDGQLPKFVEALVQSNKFYPPVISFEKEKVKILPIQKEKAAFVKYSFPIEGNFQLLKFCPFSSDNRGWRVPVQIDLNTLSFELNAEYATIDFSPQKKKEIKERILAVTEWIKANVEGIKNALDEYNASLYGFLLPRVEARLNKAKQKEQNKIDLNPF